MLPDAVRASDEPLADLTIVPLLAVLRLAREHVKVALSGEGSDEVLAGYNLERRSSQIRDDQADPTPAFVADHTNQSSAEAGVRASPATSSVRSRAFLCPSGTSRSKNYMSLHWERGRKRPRCGRVSRAAIRMRFSTSMYAAAEVEGSSGSALVGLPEVVAG